MKRHIVHRPPGPRALELARLAELLLQGSNATDTAAAIAKLLRVRPDAALLALKLADHEGRGKRATKHQPRPRGSGQVQRAQARIETYYRAAFIRNSARRMSVRMRGGASPADAVAAERRYWAMHEQARRSRQDAANEVAQASAKYGRTDAGVPLLGWYTHKDDRVTPECAAAEGANFRADVMPMIGWPGTLHGGTCRCRPGPPHLDGDSVDRRTARMVSSKIGA